MPLPPLGKIGPNEQASVIGYIAGLAKEDNDAAARWQEIGDQGMEWYLAGTEDESGEPPYGNDIQGDITTIVYLQTKEPITVSLDPVERGEPPLVFWDGDEQQGLTLGIPEMFVSGWVDEVSGEFHAPEPMPDAIAEGVQQMILGGALTEDCIVEVSDEKVAEVYQTVFDVLWARSLVDMWAIDNLLATYISGWSYALYEFDSLAKKHILTELSVKQVHVDPTNPHIEHAAHAGVDLLVDADAAVRKFPHLSEVIRRNAATGQPSKTDSTANYGGLENINYEREMVPISIWWFRDQIMPFSEQEAIDSGDVEQRAIQEEDEEVPGAIRERMAYFAAGSDREISPTMTDDRGVYPHPEWPGRPYIRQITMIGNEVAEDKECEHWDIPLLQNVCISIPRKPYGLGEPYRLKNLQSAKNRMWDSIVKHAQSFAFPDQDMPRSVYEALKTEYGEAYMEPGKVRIWDDELWREFGGKPANTNQPPQISPALVQLQPMLKAEMNDAANNIETIKGQVPPRVSSGSAIGMLQDGANSAIGFKSQRTGFMIVRAANLMTHAIRKWMTWRDIAEIVSQYSDHVLQAICERGDEMEWNITAVISSGNGMMQRQRRAEAVEQFSIQDPATGKTAITLETLRDRLNVDHAQEEQRGDAAAQKVARQMAQQAAMMPQPAATNNPAEQPSPV